MSLDMATVNNAKHSISKELRARILDQNLHAEQRSLSYSKDLSYLLAILRVAKFVLL